MPWNESLNGILPVLADYYADEEDARRVASEAGLRPERIDLSGKAINIWQSILEEALQADRVPQLFALVEREYPQFKDAAASFKPEQTTRAAGAGVTSRLPRLPGLSWPGWLALVVVVGLAGFFLTRQLRAGSDPAPPRFYAGQQFSGPDLELTVNPGSEGLTPETARDFIRLSALEFGRLEGDAGENRLAYNFRLVLRNVFAAPLLLDVDRGHFSLEDAQGRPAPLVYFCCAARGKALAPGEEREFQLIYGFLPGWTGKGGPARAEFRVLGLRPLVSATRSIPLPKVAN